MAEINLSAPQSGDTVVGLGAAEYVEGVNAGTKIQLDGANGESCALKVATSEETGLSGASATISSLIPAGSHVVGVVGRVTTAVTGASATDVGDGTDVDIFANDVAIAVDTTFDLTDSTSTGGVGVYAAANDVVLTAVTSNFTAGAIRVSVFYYEVNAPGQ